MFQQVSFHRNTKPNELLFSSTHLHYSVLTIPYLAYLQFPHLAYLQSPASVDLASFSKCFPGPEANGFRHICSESFVATASVHVWEREGLLSWKLVEEESFHLAALEFGGKYTCGEKCAGGHRNEGKSEL
jgi:hypothetical protein